MTKILALWAMPRSTSTAFERMMRERGDFCVHDEPFGKSYYYSEERRNTIRYPDVEPDARYNYDRLLERLQQENETQRVFLKDMSYQIAPVADRAFLSNFQNSFLIRDPKKALLSLFNNWPDFTLEEAGYAELYNLFELDRELTGQQPVVIDSNDLVNKPKATVKAYCEAIGIPFIEAALEWKSEPQPEINQWEGGWHNDVLSSQGFKERKKKHYTKIEDSEHLTQAYEFCLPYYQKLYDNRLQVD